MAKNNKENKDLLEVGQKARAGRLFSEYLRAIGTERTEVATVFTDPDTGEKRIISKAEMLMRYVWSQALEEPDAKTRLEYIKFIIDRCEGKPSAAGDEGMKRPGVPDKISQVNKNRLNQMVDGE